MIKNRPKVVLAAPSINAIGGIEIYIQNLITGLVSRQWNVQFVATNERGNFYAALSETVPCHDLSLVPLSVNKVSIAADLINAISPDILLLNNCSLLHYALPMLERTIKPVVVLHSDDQRFYRIATSFSRRVFRWVAPTEGLAGNCKKYLAPELWDRIRIIPHGIKGDIFHPGERNYDDPSIRITFLGFVAENKGADILPSILSRVVCEYPNFRCTVIGYGPLLEDIARSFSNRGVADRCFFTGALDSRAVSEILRNTDIFLLPTRIEGFGISIVEAMMSGAVPIVSRLNGVTDNIVEDGRNGFLVEPDDVQGFAHAIVYLACQRGGLKSMSKAAHATAIDKFSSARMISSYESLFAEEDNRESLTRRGTFGWIGETLKEVTKKDVDGNRSFKRILGAARHIVNMSKSVK